MAVDIPKRVGYAGGNLKDLRRVLVDLDAAITANLSMPGITADAAEINKLDGMTATKAELNKLAGTSAGLTAAELSILDGVTVSKDSLNLTALIENTVDFTVTAGAANVCEVAVDPQNAEGASVAGPRIVEVWLSDAATGAGVTGTTASGTVTTKAAEGSVHETLTAKKHLRVQTKANGQFTIAITDTAKTGFYVAVLEPTTGVVSVSSQLVAGNYGA